MVTCGISIASSEAILVWVDAPSLRLLGGARVSLSDPYDKADLSRTCELVRQLLAEKRTELVVVRKSSTSGKFGASHVAFRLETIISLSTPCELAFVTAQSVAAFIRREEPTVPEELKKYQLDAYLAVVSRAS
jgi:hypothetical protein